MDSIEELKILHEAVLGQELREERDPVIILQMLEDGKSDIITDLNWGEMREGEYHERHKIILQGISDDNRVIFYNPMGHPGDMEEGELIEGRDKGPTRQVEGIGIESVGRDEFIGFFESRGAVCFIPG